MDTALDDLWRSFCKQPTTPIKGYQFRWPDFNWYSEDSESAFEDFEMCRQDAEHGVGEAQNRMIAFLAWRMKS